MVDSSEEIQTIDEQSRESSLDLTNRNSLQNNSERPFFTKLRKLQLQQDNYFAEDAIQTTTGRLSTHNEKRQSKKPSRNNSNHNLMNNKKKDVKKESQEKNSLQIQYERALDLKYNQGMKKKQQQKQQQQQQLIEEIIPAQQGDNDHLSPKFIYLKLSPRAINNQIINNQQSSYSNAYSSGNTNSSISQKDELANFKKQINNLISKENEIKTFFSGSNSTTPSNVQSESTTNENQKANIFKIQVHNTQGQLLSTQQILPNKNQLNENEKKDDNPSTLSERIPSQSRLLQQNNKIKEDKQQKYKEDGNLFDKLMKQNISNNKNSNEKQPLKRSASAKQVAIKSDMSEQSPKSLKQNAFQQIYNKQSPSVSQQLSSTQPKKPCLKANSQNKLQINQFNLQIQHGVNSQQDKTDQPLLISDLQGRSSPKYGQQETQKVNVNPIIPSSYNNQLYSQSQIQFGKPTMRSMNGQLGTPNSTNLSMYQNIQNTGSIMSLRQQIENKILRSKDSISTPTLASFSAGPSHENTDSNQLNNSHHFNSKKVVAFHNQLINSDKPKQQILEETSKVVVVQQNETNAQRGRFPLPLPPQRNNQQAQQQPQRQSMDKRSSSLPKASYESLVQSALMRQQVFGNFDKQNNTENDKNKDNSQSQETNNMNSYRNKSPNAQVSSRNNTTRGSDGVNIPSSIDKKKRTDSLQVRNSSSSKQDQQSNNKNKPQSLLRQSSERTIKVNNNNNNVSGGINNSTSLSNSLFYKPNINQQGLIITHNFNNISDSHFSQVRINNSSVKTKSSSQLDQYQQDNEQKSLLAMDIIERNNTWLTQRKLKNEQRKLEQEQKEIEGCTFKPKLRSKSPMNNNNMERDDAYSQYSYQNTGYSGQSEQNIQQLMQQQNDLYSSYFNKSSISRTGGGGTKVNNEGYSYQHQLNQLRKSSLNSVGSQKVKQIFPQNFFVNQYN